MKTSHFVESLIEDHQKLLQAETFHGRKFEKLQNNFENKRQTRGSHPKAFWNKKTPGAFRENKQTP